MKKRIYSWLILTFVIATFTIGNVVAQTPGSFENNTNGVYRTKNHKGIIRMYGMPANAMGGTTESDGAFTGTSRLGQTAATRIDGTVVWAQKDTQNAQTTATTWAEAGTNGMFYYNLGVANSGYKVFKYANVANTFLRYPDDGTVGSSSEVYSVDIAHVCDGIFTYDGKGDGTTLAGNSIQTVLNTILDGSGASHDNVYAQLRIVASDALVADTVRTRNLNIDTVGKLSITDDANTIWFPELTVDAQFIAPMEGATCNLFSSEIYGDLDIAKVGIGNGNSIFNVENNTEIVIKTGGSMTNNAGDSSYWFDPGTYVANAVNDTLGKNPTTNANYPATVRYETNGGTTDVIMPTTADNPYARLVVEGNDTLFFGGNVYVGGHADDAFYFTGSGNLFTGTTATPDATGVDCGGSFAHSAYKYALVFTEPDAYSKIAATAEVYGWMQRNKWFAEKQYNWHNSATKFALGDVSANVNDTVAKEFAFEVIPNISTGTGDPSLAKTAAAGTGYINRLFEVRIPSTSDGIYMTNILLGFKYTAEVQDSMGVTGVSDVKWSTVRGFEAWLGSTSEMALLTGALTTGVTTWGAANSDGTLVADGGQPTTVVNGFAAMRLKDSTGKITLNSNRTDDGGDVVISCAQIVFGNQPTVLVSNKNGRWSNPNTWGDVYGNNLGMTPTSSDSVIIANVVYTGWYEGATTSDNLFDIAGWGVNEYDLPGVLVNDEVVLAKSVTILSKTEADNRITISSPGGNDDASDALRNTYGVALVIGNGENPTAAVTESSTHNPATSNGIDLSGMYYGKNTNGAGAPTILTNAGIGTPLLFGTIFNNAGSATNGTGVDNLTVANAKGTWNLGQLAGLIITDGKSTTDMYLNTVSGPIVNPETLLNAGEIINNSVLDVGRQHTNP